MCVKLKYIQISLDIHQHISYHAESKKGKKLTYQLSKYTKCLTSGSVSNLIPKCHFQTKTCKMI